MATVAARKSDPEESLPRMTLGEHLDELRRRVVRAALALALGIVAAFFFHKEIFLFVKRPYDDALAATKATASMQGLGPLDGFMASMKLCFLASAVATGPYVLAQLWGFVAAGLYPKEKRGVRVFFPISLVLFAVGCVFAYVIVLPIGMRFLIGWNKNLDLSVSFGVGPYLSLCISLVFGLGVAFELPLLMLFVQAVGIFGRGTFLRHWRVAVLTAFVLAMVLTPDTSPVSMTLVALPLVALYFLGAYGGKFVGAGRIPFRFWHAWPVLLVAALMGALFWFRGEIAAWAGRLFS
jgi:sec-independent protein translocase protein TatC